jgi:hypothetical protein
MKQVYLILLLLPLVASAADADFTLVIKDHRFQPSKLSVPAGKKIKLLIDNKDTTPEEFESHSLNREKVIAGNSTAIIYIGPLESGRYPFFGEFNEATAQGAIIAK